MYVELKANSKRYRVLIVILLLYFQTYQFSHTYAIPTNRYFNPYFYSKFLTLQLVWA
jgi:hypothetical protein